MHRQFTHAQQDVSHALVAGFSRLKHGDPFVCITIGLLCAALLACHGHGDRDAGGNLEGDIRDILRGLRAFPKNMRLERRAVEFDVSDPAKRDRVRELIFERNPGVRIDTLDTGGFRIGYTEEAISNRRSDVVRQALEIIRIRIDETGTREPTIQRQGDERILLQIPGVDDPERVKAVLNTTAKLTFHLAHPEVYGPGRRTPPARRRKRYPFAAPGWIDISC